MAKYYQVYVNGRYAGTTNDNEQTQMVVAMPTSSCSAVRIGVFAVEANEADRDLNEQIAELQVGNGRVRMKLLRSQRLPIGSVANIYSDGGTGEIDCSVSLNRQPVEVWPNLRDKTGFALSMFGEGDFGYESVGAVGFGRGNFGNGLFGMDADSIEWVSFALLDGVYLLGVTITDSVGNESALNQTSEVITISQPEPAVHLGLLSYENTTNELALDIL